MTFQLALSIITDNNQERIRSLVTITEIYYQRGDFGSRMEFSSRPRRDFSNQVVHRLNMKNFTGKEICRLLGKFTNFIFLTMMQVLFVSWAMFWFNVSVRIWLYALNLYDFNHAIVICNWWSRNWLFIRRWPPEHGFGSW